MQQQPNHLRLPKAAPLGEGQTAIVYPWHGDTVLKLFRPGIARFDVEAEARSTRIAHALDVGAPRVEEPVDIDGSPGLVFERVAGRSMLQLLVEQPARAESLAARLAQLHALVHSREAPPQMPAQLTLLRAKADRAEIPNRLRERVSRALADVPTAHSLCHGDFHPANLMLDGERHSIIDWNDAARGCPALDVARTTVVLLGAAVDGSQVIADQARVIEVFHSAYLDHYFNRCPDQREAYRRLLPLAAVGRLSEPVGGARAWLLQLAEQCP